MAVPLREDQPSVLIDSGEVVILALRVDDPDVVELVSSADDAAQAVESCLTLGARVMRTTQTTIDAAVVEKRFAQLEHRVDNGLDNAVNLIAETAAHYLDPDKGALRTMLRELEKGLGDAFDPKSKASILGNFDRLLSGGTNDLQKVVRDLVDPGNPDSPLGRLRSEISIEVKNVRETVDELRLQLVGSKAAAEALDLTAIKGRKFEETVFDVVAGFVSLYDDEPEAVGDQNGAGGRRCGDIVVAINESDASRADARYVVEVKDRKLSMRAAMRELDAAMRNRAAAAGLIVFADQEQAPTTTPLQTFGSKAVVVLDKHDPDPHALRFALANARCVALRQLHIVGKDADLEAVAALIEEGQRALGVHVAIKRSHTIAGKEIESAGVKVAGLVDQLDGILGQIALKLRS